MAAVCVPGTLTRSPHVVRPLIAKVEVLWTLATAPPAQWNTADGRVTADTGRHRLRRSVTSALPPYAGGESGGKAFRRGPRLQQGRFERCRGDGRRRTGCTGHERGRPPVPAQELCCPPNPPNRFENVPMPGQGERE